MVGQALFDGIAIFYTARATRLERIKKVCVILIKHRVTLLRTGAYTPETLVAQEDQLNVELNKLNNGEAVSDIAMAETVKEAVKLSELLKSPKLLYKPAEPPEKDEMIRIVFSELTIKGETLGYSCKKGFIPLASRFFPNYDPTGNRTPISTVKGSRPSR